MEDKISIRQSILKSRAQFFNDRDHQRICDTLVSCLKDEVKNVHIYLPMADEINITPFINHCLDNRITLYASVSLKGGILEHRVLESLEKLEAGIFGTRHPIGNSISLPPMDLIVVPGLAYDRCGYRIGYGGGYYDRFLSTQDSALFIAPCYRFQILDHVPHDDYDIPVHGLALPDGYLAIAK